MKIKAKLLKGKTVVSPDGKAKWSKDGDEHTVDDAAGAEMLKRAPRGMFEVTSGEDPMKKINSASDNAKKEAAEYAAKKKAEAEKSAAAAEKADKSRQKEAEEKKASYEKSRKASGKGIPGQAVASKSDKK